VEIYTLKLSNSSQQLGDVVVVKPIRLRDFIQDYDGWMYAVSTYDNERQVGCILRYIPDENGERVHPSGKRYHKLDFAEAFDLIGKHKPHYSDLVQRLPIQEIKQVLKPEEEIYHIAKRNNHVNKLISLFHLPAGSIGCTGSFLCGLEDEHSDIDLVVYGNHWFLAQQILRTAIINGAIGDLDDKMWNMVYKKRQPSISFDNFIIHERRKWNRGAIDGTYFDLLFVRSYDNLTGIPSEKGKIIGKLQIEAEVMDASLAFDSPAIYEVKHKEIRRILSFTHTYCGQALAGEIIEAQGICEQHGTEKWLIVGTSRVAPDEYIISKTLMEKKGLL